MRLVLVAFMIISMLFSPAPAGAAETHEQVDAVVTLNEHSVVDPHEKVDLGDVSTIDAAEAVAYQLSILELTSPPHPGRSKSIDSNYIKSKVSRRGFNIEIRGPRRVHIEGDYKTLTASELEQYAMDCVQSQLPRDGKDYRVSVYRNADDIVLPPCEDIRVEPNLAWRSVRLGTNTVALNIYVDGEDYKRITTSIKVEASAYVLTATQPIARGDHLTANNTAWEERDISRSSDPVIAGDDWSIPAWVSTRNVTVGDIISTRNVELPPAVERGDEVIVVVKSGGVVLRARGVAKDSGAIGDRVRVETYVSDEEVHARVAGPGVVHIMR